MSRNSPCTGSGVMLIGLFVHEVDAVYAQFDDDGQHDSNGGHHVDIGGHHDHTGGNRIHEVGTCYTPVGVQS